MAQCFEDKNKYYIVHDPIVFQYESIRVKLSVAWGKFFRRFSRNVFSNIPAGKL